MVLVRIAEAGGRLVERARRVMPPEERTELLELSRDVAATEEAWIGVVDRLGQAAVNLRNIARIPEGTTALVERFFGLLTEHALKRGSHTSIPELRGAIYEYIEAHNEDCVPFKWTKTADEILESVKRCGKRILKVHGGRHDDRLLERISDTGD